MRKPKIRFYKKLIFSFLPAIFIVSLVETGFRIFYHEQKIVRGNAGMVEEDRELLWKLKAYSGGPFKTNELGFRDRPVNLNAEGKILLLGDSVSWGDCILVTDMVYPQLLEDRLTAINNGKSVEIINSAVPGYSTFQQLKYFKTKGIALNPDAVILQFCLNDVVERYNAVFEYGGADLFMGIDTKKQIRGLRGFLLRNSTAFRAIVRYLQNRARSKQEYDVKMLMSEQIDDKLEKAWTETFNEIKEIADICRTSGMPFIVVIFPYRIQVEQSDIDRSQPQKKLKNFLLQNDILFIDLLPAFKNFSKKFPENTLFEDQNHMSACGHALTASILEPIIFESFKNKNIMQREKVH